MSESTSHSSQGVLSVLARYGKLLLEDTRLGLAEKLTRLLTAVTMVALLAFLGLVALIFITIGVSCWLAPVLSPMWSFFIMSAIYIIIIGVLVAFKRQLVVDPIARFVTSLLVEAPAPPKEPAADDKPAPIP